MAKLKKQADKNLSILAQLDQLIVKYGQLLQKQMTEDVKLGDFLKMIELRRKLSKTDAEIKDFWSLIEGVRQAGLSASASHDVAESGPSLPPGRGGHKKSSRKRQSRQSQAGKGR